MPDAGMRARVERLLRGDYRADDLTRLFLYARDRCDGREPVQEIGDFVAHHDERAKGIVTRETRDWFITVAQSGPWAKPFVLFELPPNFREFLAASFRRSGGAVKKAIGITRAEASKLMPDIQRKFITNVDGTLSISLSHTNKEMRLIQILCGTLTARPAFTNDRLFEDFAATIRNNGLLKKSEMKAFNATKPLIGLYTASIMHNCTIRLDDGGATQLKVSNVGGIIEVCAYVPVPHKNPGGGTIFIASAIFSTGLDASKYCDQELLQSAAVWNFELEVTPQGKLTKLA